MLSSDAEIDEMGVVLGEDVVPGIGVGAEVVVGAGAVNEDVVGAGVVDEEVAGAGVVEEDVVGKGVVEEDVVGAGAQSYMSEACTFLCSAVSPHHPFASLHFEFLCCLLALI